MTDDQRLPTGRVLCAMSGGVDSSLAAALLHEAGCEVIGVTLHLWDAHGKAQVGRCCSPEDRDDARLTCELLGVPHYVIDERAAFRERVVEPFLDENLLGRTPIPCVHCNQEVKLGRLWPLAQELGASCVATGHYARIAHDADGGVQLLRGVDREKDQSYFLFGVPQSILQHLYFPLGAMTKSEAREHAKRLGLPNWNKPDSQELCFLPDRDVSGFVASQRDVSGKSGPIEDESGRVLGEHAGIEGFTVGQRRGLGLGGGAPRYVLRVVGDRNAVVVGPAESLAQAGLQATGASWTGQAPSKPFFAEVRIRYRHQAASAWVKPFEGGFAAEFVEPQRAVAPGQAAVVYRGDAVVGGGFIA